MNEAMEKIEAVRKRAEQQDLTPEDKEFLYDVMLNVTTDALVKVHELGKLLMINDSDQSLGGAQESPLIN